jgi:uncharacterized protein (TIGR03067 family)
MNTVKFAIMALTAAVVPTTASGSDCVSLRRDHSVVYLRPYYFPPGLLPGDEVDIYVRDDVDSEGRLIVSTSVFAVREYCTGIYLELPKALARTLPLACKHNEVIVAPSSSSTWTLPATSKCSCSQEHATTDDAKMIQGVWETVACEIHGEDSYHLMVLKVGPDTFQFQDENGKFVAQDANYLLRQSKIPKEIDIIRKCNGKTTIQKGIYSLTRDTLRLCFSKDRPTEFASTPDDGTSIVITFRRK